MASNVSHTVIVVGKTAGHLSSALGDVASEFALSGEGEQLADRAVEFVLDIDADQQAALAKKIRDHTYAGVDIALLPSKNRKKRLLVCDMDSTIIEQECLDELADYAGLKAEISAITERAMAGELDFEGALTERVSMLKGLDLSALAQCYEERITLSPGAKTLVQTMVTNGARCLLVSGGFTFFTSRVADLAGFHANHANRLCDDGAALTGDVERPILGREAKLETLLKTAIDLGLSADDALAMGDGANDLAMIEAAGLGIAYDAKPVVAAQARAAIQETDLTTALFYQGYRESEFVV